MLSTSKTLLATAILSLVAFTGGAEARSASDYASPQLTIQVRDVGAVDPALIDREPIYVHQRNRDRHGGYYGNHGGHVRYGPVRTFTERSFIRQRGPYKVFRVCHVQVQRVVFRRHGQRYVDRRVLGRECHRERVFIGHHGYHGHNSIHGHGRRGGHIEFRF